LENRPYPRQLILSGCIFIRKIHIYQTFKSLSLFVFMNICCLVTHRMLILLPVYRQ
jgi:hypothetical protein